MRSSATHIESLKILEDKFGEVMRSNMTGESVYYSARWEEIRDKAGVRAKQIGYPEPGDIRAADYALDLIGFPYHSLEADTDEAGEWFIYWR